MNTHICQCKISFLDIVIGFLVTSKSITCLALGVILVGYSYYSWEDNNGVELPQFVYDLPGSGLLEFKLFGNRFFSLVSTKNTFSEVRGSQRSLAVVKFSAVCHQFAAHGCVVCAKRTLCVCAHAQRTPNAHCMCAHVQCVPNVNMCMHAQCTKCTFRAEKGHLTR